jgi:hypothetical protein
VEVLKVGGKLPQENEGQADLLQGLWIGATALLASAYLYSVIEGFMNRPPLETVIIEQEILSTTPTLRLTPAAGGLGLGVSGSF